MNPLDEDMTAFVRYRIEKAEESYASSKHKTVKCCYYG